MNEEDIQPQDQQAIRDWFEQPLGQALQAIEADRLRPLLANLFAVRAAQIGSVGRMDLLSGCNAPNQFRLVQDQRQGDTSLLALPEQLPFDNRSLDLVLLPHTLDFCLSPHQVLRETERVLVPEGHAVIIGFNPVSLWGLRRLFTRRARRQPPWQGNFIGLRRIKDWLALMHFDVTAGSMMFYRPPLANPHSLERLFVLDKIGDRWWPMMAAVYVLVAKKRVAGMTPLRPHWRMRLIKGVGLAQSGSAATGHTRQFPRPRLVSKRRG